MDISFQVNKQIIKKNEKDYWKSQSVDDKAQGYKNFILGNQITDRKFYVASAWNNVRIITSYITLDFKGIAA